MDQDEAGSGQGRHKNFHGAWSLILVLVLWSWGLDPGPGIQENGSQPSSGLTHAQMTISYPRVFAAQAVSPFAHVVPFEVGLVRFVQKLLILSLLCALQLKLIT